MEEIETRLARAERKLEQLKELMPGPDVFPPLIYEVVGGIANGLGNVVKDLRGEMATIAVELRASIGRIENIAATETKAAANLLTSEARFFGSAFKAKTPSTKAPAGILNRHLWS